MGNKESADHCFVLRALAHWGLLTTVPGSPNRYLFIFNSLFASFLLPFFFHKSWFQGRKLLISYPLPPRSHHFRVRAQRRRPIYACYVVHVSSCFLHQFLSAPSFRPRVYHTTAISQYNITQIGKKHASIPLSQCIFVSCLRLIIQSIIFIRVL